MSNFNAVVGYCTEHEITIPMEVLDSDDDCVNETMSYTLSAEPKIDTVYIANSHGSYDYFSCSIKWLDPVTASHLEVEWMFPTLADNSAGEGIVMGSWVDIYDRPDCVSDASIKVYYKDCCIEHIEAEVEIDTYDY